jgi:hypothetical protein
LAAGRIITAVAVLESHIERKAAASIKPKMIAWSFVPTSAIMLRAILL